MNEPIVLYFESELSTSSDKIWESITSVKSIRKEIQPFFTMTAPQHIKSLGDIKLALGKPLFRSYVLLLGIIPIDYSDMTLLELEEKLGFVEQSPMKSMKLWRHERSIKPHHSKPDTVILIDKLIFQPRRAKILVKKFIEVVFTHRHKVLKKHFNHE